MHSRRVDNPASFVPSSRSGIMGIKDRKEENRSDGDGETKPERSGFDMIKELLESGRLIPVIERRYPLRETAEAIRYLEAEHAKGKVVITVQQNDHTYCLTITM